jgi:hypothetical protein
MSVSSVSLPVPMTAAEASQPRPPEIATNTVDSPADRPPVVAALPPGQGTRINQLV